MKNTFHSPNRFQYILFIMSVFITLISSGAMFAEDTGQSSVCFQVDASRPGKIIGNKLSNINLWTMQQLRLPTVDEGANLSEFVEYIQFMQATGSSVPRELFRNPEDMTVKNDYYFEPLEEACRKTLTLGAKPHIKFSVPIKYVNDYKAGVFNTNVYPPDDWDGYYQFIRALAKNLVDKFGREEVQTWRFGCLVEFENADWFRAKSGDPEETKEAFFKLYDYTVEGLIQEIGPDVFVGAHAMACSEGLWDERELLDHCAHGTNYKTGETGTRICFMAASFYDVKPGVLCPLSLPTVIQRLRERAENVGLTNLIYGVDEGRILGSTKGRDATDLVHRIVGQTYQAASDARLYTQMTENDIDYFSSWTYSTDSPWNGYPTVAWHVANNFSKFRDAALLPINKEEQLAPQVETEAVAGFDAAQNTLHLMAYHFKPEFHFQGTLQTTFTVNVPQFKGQKVSVETFLIDDSNNFFNDWLLDRETFGIDDQCFSWSPDSTAIDHSILDPEKNKIYQEKLRPKYLEKAQIKPIVSEQTVSEDGLLTFETVLGPHAVVFYTVKPVK